MIQVNRIYLIFNRLVTKKFLVDTSEAKDKIKTTNMPNTMWQMAILNLLDEFPETAEFFKRL